MDPVTALGVAAATVQFIDFGLKTLALCRQIRDSDKDTIELHAELQQSSKELDGIRKGVTLPNFPSDTSRAIKQTSQTCATAAEELKNLLSEIRTIAQTKRFGTLRAALRSIKDQKKIEKLERKLEQCQAKFQTAVSVDTRQLVIKLLEEQGKASQTIKDVVLPELKKMHDETLNAHRETQGQISAHQAQSRASHIETLSAHRKTQEQISTQQGHSKASHAQTRQRIAAMKTEQRASNSKITRGQSVMRKEMHDRFDSAESRTNTSSRYDKLLRSLEYPEMFMRHRSIHSPSRSTYEWIFTGRVNTDERYSHEHSEHRGRFSLWLKSDDRFFWVNGKAGSGKSSLMSFIEGDERTKDALQHWSGRRPLHIFSFFFWRPGSELQKSVQGLMQSLLYQLVRSKPILVSSIDSTDHSAMWTQARLLRTLQQALSLCRDDCVFCLIDGLDEFEGNYALLVDTLLELQSMCRIKICVSSRPEPALRKKLGRFPSLRLQDLNRIDIEAYARKQLAYCENLSMGFVEQVTDRAEGVFLWTVLVCKSLISGSDAKDDKKVMQRRLEAMPSGLEPLFAHMFANIEDYHRESLSVYFCLLNASQSIRVRPSLALVTVIMCDRSLESLQDFFEECEILEHRIVAQSKGLLEINHQDSDSRTFHDSLQKWALVDIRSGCFRHHFLDVADCPPGNDHVASVLTWVHRSASDCITGTSGHTFTFRPEPFDSRDVMRRALDAAAAWLACYCPVFLERHKTGSISPAGFGDLLFLISKIATTTDFDLTKQAYEVLDEIHDAMCESLQIVDDTSSLGSAATTDIVHDRLNAEQILICFWVSVGRIDDYICSRIENITKSPYAVRICGSLINYIVNSETELGNKYMSPLADASPAALLLLRCLTETSGGDLCPAFLHGGRAFLVTWKGRGTSGEVRAMQDLSNACILLSNIGSQAATSLTPELINQESFAVHIMTTCEAWDIFMGTRAALPLQIQTQGAQYSTYMTASLPHSLRSSKRILRFVCFDIRRRDKEESLKGTGKARVYAHFSLSLAGTNHLMMHLCDQAGEIRRPILRFTGHPTDRADCLKIVVSEIWADTEGQLDAWKQLYVLACVKKWFDHFWPTEDELEKLKQKVCFTI